MLEALKIIALFIVDMVLAFVSVLVLINSRIGEKFVEGNGTGALYNAIFVPIIIFIISFIFFGVITFMLFL